MTTQPKALRLADALMDYYKCDDQDIDEAAAELRRLHAENEVMRNVANRGGHMAVAMSRIADLEAQRDALLEALNDIANTDPVDAALDPQRAVRIARAAIKAVEEA